MLKKRDRIVASNRKQETRCITKSNKFGIEFPKTVEQTLALDAKNGNTVWADAISEELENNIVAFEILSDGKKAPIGQQFVQCHMVFDIKMEVFRHKARQVAGSHMNKTPATNTYASVMSRQRVRIALMIVTLNDLEAKSGGILNAYV